LAGWLLVCYPYMFAGAQSNKALVTQHLTTANGLPSNTVYTMYRDSKGLLWIGTDKGLAKYDGISYTIFTMKEGLPDNEVFQVLEDRYGRLWLSTFTGPLCYIQHNRVVPFSHPVLQANWNKHTSGYVLKWDNNRDVLIYQFHSDFIYHIQGQSVLVIPAPHTATSNFRVNDVEKNNDSTLYLYVNVHLMDYTVVYQYTFRTRQYRVSDTIYYYRRINGGIPISIFHDAIHAYDKRSFKLPADMPADVVKGFAYQHGIAHIIHHSQYTRIQGGQSISSWVPMPSSIYTDSADMAWITTLGNGIYQMGPTVFKSSPFPQPVEYAQQFDDGEIYSTATHIYVIKGPLRTVIRKQADAVVKSAAWLDGYLLLVFQNGNCAISQQPWQGSKNNCPPAFTFFKETAFKNYVISGGQLLGNAITSVSIYDIKSNVHTRLARFNSRVNNITADPNGTVYIVNEDKLKMLDRHTGQVVSADSSLLFKKCQTLGDYFVAMNKDNELMVRKGATGQFERIDAGYFEQLEYLAPNVVRAQADNYHLIIRYEAGALQLYKLPGYYLPTDYVGIGLRDSQLVVYAPQEKRTAPLELFKVKYKAPVLYLNHAQYGHQIYTDTQLRFRHQPNQLFSIDVDNLAGDGGRPQLLVRVNGGAWMTATAYNKATLVLSPGQNTIELKPVSATNRSGNTVVIRVYAFIPFWRSSWFLFVATALLVAGLSYLFYRYRIRRKEKRFRQKLEGIKAEFKYLNALMNPHFVFNSMNSIAYLVSQKENEAAEKYITVLAKLIRQNMENLHQDFISLEAELLLVQHYFELEQLRFKTRIQLDIQCGDPILLRNTYLPPLSLQPLVENAIKHGLNYGELPGKISIVAQKLEQEVLLQVLDNGKGLAEARAESMALNMLQTRSAGLTSFTGKTYTYTIERLLEAGQVKGTKVELRIKEQG
jgi:hypothetical protein